MVSLLLIIFLFPISAFASTCDKNAYNDEVNFSCRERCCGLPKQCLPTCENVTCATSNDCDGLTCCNRKCKNISRCPKKKRSIKIWLTAWLACVAVVVLVLFGYCCCIKKKSALTDSTIHTEISDTFLSLDERSQSLETVITWPSKENVRARESP